MFDVKGHLHEVLDTLPQGVRLVAISKYHPNEYIEAAYAEGQRIFGESHEQELRQKHESLPKDIEWHFIGHLQTNKVKYIAPYVSMIEAVDSIKLLREINKQAEKCGRVIKVLLELHIAEESTKYGLTLDACRQLEMQTARDFFDEVKAQYFVDDVAFCERSWGMSDDYPVALETGTTMVRIGTAIFGPRVY